MTNNPKNIWLKAGKELWGSTIAHFKEQGLWENVVWESSIPEANYRVNRSYMSEINHPVYAGCPENVYNQLYEDLYLFVEMYSRNSPWGQCYYSNKTVHDILNIFNRQIDYYHHHLIKNETELLILKRAPHNGHDYVLYKVARALGITTLILEQTLFPNKFFYYFDNEDFGEFKTARLMSEPEPYPIEKKYEKDLFYMKNLILGSATTKKADSSAKLGWIRDFYKTLSKSDEGRLLRQLFTDEGLDSAVFRYRLEKKYKKRLNNFIRHDINLDVPFVYFPLHFQPEKTTSNWGGIYNDQVLALERLSTAIPPDWKIYIKENPKQNGYMRGKWFFERLKSIPNLIMVPIDMNTYELLDKSQFVATVTGTAGWEAITGGKNALIFGWGVWYKSLPGVFQYEEGMDVTKILNNKIDHSQLEKRFGDLYALMADGVIYRGYETMIPGFDTRDNIKTVIRSLTRIIYQQD